jgi:transposase
MIRTVGIDLGKSVFHAVAMDAKGNVVARKRFSRSQLLQFMANLPACTVAMEASCGSHSLGRRFADQGHDVRLIAAQFVRPFVKSNKNDFVDAEAIAEAAQRPTMRFVSLKTEEQLDIQALHRVRDRLVARRTGIINQLRAFLLERGITAQTGRQYLKRFLPATMAELEGRLSPRMLRIIRQLWDEWNSTEQQIDSLTNEIEGIARHDDACQRLTEIPGVGPLVATALVAAIGNGSAFGKGRDLSAWLGRVPKQQTTGGKPKLMGISKRGNPYVRRLLIHGARSVIRHSRRGNSCISTWITELEGRAHANVVAVGLANKIARICWAVLARGATYRSAPVIAAT